MDRKIITIIGMCSSVAGVAFGQTIIDQLSFLLQETTAQEENTYCLSRYDHSIFIGEAITLNEDELVMRKFQDSSNVRSPTVGMTVSSEILLIANSGFK